jgi:hypothetical protein
VTLVAGAGAGDRDWALRPFWLEAAARPEDLALRGRVGVKPKRFEGRRIFSRLMAALCGTMLSFRANENNPKHNWPVQRRPAIRTYFPSNVPGFSGYPFNANERSCGQPAAMSSTWVDPLSCAVRRGTPTGEGHADLEPR